MATQSRFTEPSVVMRSRQASAPAPTMLVSWKDIANFFGKGVRTVQRWEDMGMPVHRPSTDRNIVFADPEELRVWALGKRAKLRMPEHERCEQLLQQSRLTVEKTRRLIQQSESLLQKLRQFSCHDAGARTRIPR